ncbi:PAS domain S-box protein [Reinekea marina]|uniref:histidine kinase n=1 Tax=Reinekea marina TaxID=1310421 RepID=A0ABV7WQQ9_9GAMM|nr:ATP-binding protein [Reinekea marina]MDN3648103.1 PAS domain S-box protein [Reinekea marina]
MISPPGLLKPKASVAAVLLLAVSVFFTVMYGYSVYQQAEQEAINDTSLYAQSAARELRQYFDKYTSDVRMLANSPLVADIVAGQAYFSNNPNDGENNQRLARIFKAYMGSNEQVVQARLIGLANDGQEIVRVNRLNGKLTIVEDDLLQSKAKRGYFQDISKLSPGEIYISDIELNRDFGALTTPLQPVVRIGVPLFTKTGELFGVLLLNVDMTMRLDQMAKAVETHGSSIQILLMNSAGDYIAHPISSKNFGFEFGVPQKFSDDYQAHSDLQVVSTSTELTRYFITTEKIELNQQDRFLQVAAMTAVRPIVIKTLMSAIYLEVLILVVITAFMIYLIYSSRYMKLEQKQLALKSELEFDLIFREMIETAPYAKILINEKGLIELVNIEAEKMFGYKRSELLGQNIDMLMPKDDLDRLKEQRQQYLGIPSHGKLSTEMAYKAVKQDGTEFPIEISLTSMVTPQGRKIQATIVDISEREKFIAELSRQNEELNQFAYVASHDLKAPLRGIDQIASWLEEDLMDNVSADSQKHLKLMRSRINRMESLLAGLLQYARAGSVLGELESIDLHKLVTEDFHMINPTQRFTLKVKNPLPTLTTSKPLIDIVFRNLMSNAMKHHDRPKGRITIDWRKKGAFYQFEVCDDGPGIPEEFRDRVFGLFQTLKPRDEVEGSGMGLSIVKKTIETIGGEITIGDCDPCGAMITFTWPIELKQEPESPAA